MTTPLGTVKMSRMPSSMTQLADRLMVAWPPQMSAASWASAPLEDFEVLASPGFLVCLRMQVALPVLPSPASAAAACVRSVPHSFVRVGVGVGGWSGSAAAAVAVAEAVGANEAGTNTDNRIS